MASHASQHQRIVSLRTHGTGSKFHVNEYIWSPGATNWFSTRHACIPGLGGHSIAVLGIGAIPTLNVIVRELAKLWIYLGVVVLFEVIRHLHFYAASWPR